MSDCSTGQDSALLPRRYDEFASWWPLLSAPADFASFVHRGVSSRACLFRFPDPWGIMSGNRAWAGVRLVRGTE